MKIKAGSITFIIWLVVSISVQAQDVYLSAYKKFSSGSGDVESISFSEDSKIIGISDKKGNLCMVETESSNVLKKIPASGKVVFHEFLDKDKKFIAVRATGQFSTYALASFEETKGAQTFSSPLYVTLDPNQGYLTVLEKNNQIEIFDLKAGMTQTRIQANGDLKNTLFLGFDRFGQQLAAINNIGESFSWEFMNQKFLRELKLQSGDFTGSPVQLFTQRQRAKALIIL